MHIVASRQWRQETAMRINICKVWPSLRSSLVIYSSFYFSVSWSKMTISFKINNGQPYLWCGIFLFSYYFFFRILAILTLENIAKILTAGPRLSLTCSKLFWHTFYDVVIFTLTQRELSGSCSKLFWHTFYDVVIFTLTQRELSGSSLICV